MATDFVNKASIFLSEFAEKLDGDVKKRYKEKISEIGVDPLLVPESKFSSECLPPIESMDLLSYLVLDTSFYTNAMFKAFRRLQAYNQMVSGFVCSVLGFIQILHTGGNHWVCISSIGCQKGFVNVYDSLYNNVINDDIEEQCKNLLGDDFQRLSVVPVQQQINGSDCGVFSIAYATSFVFEEAPETIQYNIAKMRSHLSSSLKTGIIEPFPTIT